ncbi:MAG: hypothetical protein EXS55_02460 [Candidatus Magasanikbacteria bacterium]|nr:hypothetical protein [Candidatus Magasanikbacteria bacterium]
MKTKLEKIFLVIVIPLVTALMGYYGGIYSTKKGPYLQNVIESKKELGDSLASYYSAAAAIYYAEIDLNYADVKKVDKNSTYYLTLYNEENKDYQAFINASTKLSTLVPASLRDKVANIESTWDKINSEQLDEDATEKQWFRNLDDIRQLVLNNLVDKKSLDPIWK